MTLNQSEQQGLKSAILVHESQAGVVEHCFCTKEQAEATLRASPTPIPAQACSSLKKLSRRRWCTRHLQICEHALRLPSPNFNSISLSATR